MTTSCAKNIES